MKKIYALALGCAALLATSSCSDDKFTDQYQDPSKTQTVSCPALMVGVWQASNTWMNPVYYRYYVSSTTSGLFSGVIGHTNSKDRFAGAGQGYFNERWKNFYTLSSSTECWKPIQQPSGRRKRRLSYLLLAGTYSNGRTTL